MDAYFNINASGTPSDIRVGHSTMAGGLARSVESATRAIVPDDYGLIPQGADGTRIHLRVDAAPKNSFQPLVADGCRLTSTVQQTSTFTINW